MVSNKEKDTILYLDDEAINLTGFKFVFRAQYRVLIAETIAEARQLLADNLVKVIISDQKMPEMTGTDFFKSIADEYPDVIKIILTAYAESDTAIKAINEANIYQFLIKPWDKTKMEQTLKNAVNSYNLLESNTLLITDLQDQNQQIKEANDQLKQEIHVRLQTERALIQSERKFRQIFDSSSDGIIIWSNDFKVIDINHAVGDILGYTHKELLELPITTLIAPEYHDETKKRVEALFAGEEVATIEINSVCKNGELVPIEVNSKIISLPHETAILTMVRDIRPRKEQEKAVLNAVIETEERERERFARDLHDDFGPVLSSVKMYLNLLKEQDLGAKNENIIKTVGEMIDESIGIVRTTSNALSSHVLVNYGLVHALQHSVEKFKEFVSISFKTNLTDERFHSNTEAVLYRIFNELLNNTIKHAEASKVDVVIKLQDQTLRFTYTDNGKGFDLHEKIKNSSSGGIGIFNILSRVQTIDGHYIFDSRLGEGLFFKLTSNVAVVDHNVEPPSTAK